MIVGCLVFEEVGQLSQDFKREFSLKLGLIYELFYFVEFFAVSCCRMSVVSPFLLPYILADREEKQMHSPESPAFISPNGGLYPSSPDSPRVSRRSVIEASISELTFDPDLTFMDSPPPKRQRGGIPDLSMCNDQSPMQHVSPDRVVVQLDESEIGFSNELRASMEEQPKTKASKTKLLETIQEDTQKMKPKRKAIGESTPKTQTARSKRKVVPDNSPPVVKTMRKSPRFASKVLSSKDSQSSPVLSNVLRCSNCQKVYKRKDLFEKHVRDKVCLK